MKVITISLMIMALLTMPSLFCAEDAICNPDLSIEKQKSKIISPEGKALLAKIVEDNIEFQWPVRQCDFWISSLFGPRKIPGKHGVQNHNGTDFAARQGTKVVAAADAFVELVEKSSDSQGFGNMILLDHAETIDSKVPYKTRYAHLHTIDVKKGEFVKAGQKIGTVGSTGHVFKHGKNDPSHLHFEVYRGRTRVNPLLVLFQSDPDWVAQQQ